MKRVPLHLEFLFKSSPTILYQFITTPACLIRWFCDGVNINGDLYFFEWEGSEETAAMVDDIEDERVRYQWLEADENEYLEFRISVSDITGETILDITDFCDAREVNDQRRFWESQMSKLRREMGA